MAVLATPIIELVYQHESFGPASTHRVAIALFWFAISLPFSGINLLLTRTFFALQRPWIPTQLAIVNMVVDVIVSFATYKSLGLAGLIIGTLAANIVMTWLQMRRLRIGFNGRLELDVTAMITARILIATAIVTVVGWAIYKGTHAVLGDSVIALLIELALGLGIAGALYMRIVLAMRVPEAQQVQRLIAGRLGRAARG
jgi:putative peptidoglycan lipid II flippase